jgi:Dolichyl-phosphate-mannose-protein mannosyltransferase
MAQTVAATAVESLRWRQWIAPAALFLIGLGLYSINLDKPPRFDELYHVLGARGYLEYGEPRIAEGVYERARYFTAVIALLFSAFGESLVVGRLPAVVCGSLVVSLLFVWVRTVAGHSAAWFAAIAFLLSPFAAHVAQDIRFYGPLTLFFWLGAMAVYAASTAERPSPGRLAWLTLAAVACLGGALYLQILTLIGLVGLGLWLGIQVVLPWLLATRGGYARTAIALAIVVVALVVVAQFLPLGDLIARYRSTPLFDAATRDHFWFYHQWLNLYYPTLWPLFPLAALAALASCPRPALFCLCVFVIGFLLLSFGGPKAMLYAAFAWPFLFVIWGIAAAYVWTGVRGFTLKIVDGALRGLGIAPRPAIRTALIAAAVGFILLANTATIRTATMIAGIAVPPERPYPRWWDVAQPLEPWVTPASVVITSSELDALYYLGDYDILLEKSRLSELPAPAAEFDRDRRTGRPVVSTPESIDRVINCFADGVIVTDDFRWRNSAYVDDAAADLILQRTEPIPLPSKTRILAFHWGANGETRTSEACADLNRLMRPDRRG